MPTIPQLIAESRENFKENLCDRSMTVKEGIAQIRYPGTQDAVLEWHTTSVIYLIDALMEEEREAMNKITQEIDSVEDNTLNLVHCILIGQKSSKQATLSRLQAIKDELMK